MVSLDIARQMPALDRGSRLLASDLLLAYEGGGVKPEALDSAKNSRTARL